MLGQKNCARMFNTVSKESVCLLSHHHGRWEAAHEFFSVVQTCRPFVPFRKSFDTYIYIIKRYVYTIPLFNY